MFTALFSCRSAVVVSLLPRKEEFIHRGENDLYVGCPLFGQFQLVFRFVGSLMKLSDPEDALGKHLRHRKSQREDTGL